MNNDNLISEGSVKIDSYIEFYEKKLNYYKQNLKLSTNCKFSFNENEKNGFISLRVASLKELVEINGFLRNKEKSFYDGMNDLISKVTFCSNNDRNESFLTFTWLGYSYQEWSSDLSQLYAIKLYSEKVDELNKLKNKLESMYSKETKDYIEINKILNSLS